MYLLSKQFTMSRQGMNEELEKWERDEANRNALYRMLIKARDFAEQSALYLEADLIHEFSRRFQTNSLKPPGEPADRKTAKKAA
jgi:hypothetical protein